MSAPATPQAQAEATRAHARFFLHHRLLSVPWLLLRRTVREFIADRCTQMAAAIAYYLLFSLIPIVALLVAVLGLVMRIPEVRTTVVELLIAEIPVKTGLVVEGIRAVSRASEPLTIVGALALVWTAMGMFGAVRDSLNVAWGVKVQHNLLRQKLVDLGAVVGLGLLLGGSVLGTAALHTVRHVSAHVLGRYSEQMEAIWGATGWAFPATVTFVAFLFLYRFVPDVRHGFRDVWPGALVAAVLFEAGKHLFTFYVANFTHYEVLYGALGAVMLFLLWVYVSAIILLLGAELAAVYEHALRGKSHGVRPYPDVVLQPGTAAS